jgi:hypothetical protein
VRVGVAPGVKDQGFSFTVRTPHRSFFLSALAENDRDCWIKSIEDVISRPLSPQDNSSKLYKYPDRKGNYCLDDRSTR